MLNFLTVLNFFLFIFHYAFHLFFSGSFATIPSSGHAIVDFNKPYIKVEKGDMLAFHKSNTSAQVYLQQDSNLGMFQTGPIPIGSTEILTSSITNTHMFKPKIRLFYSDFFGYQLNLTEPSPGSLEIAYEFDGIRNQTIILVQVIKLDIC